MRLPRILRFRWGFVAMWLAVGALLFLAWAWWWSYQYTERITFSRHARAVIISDSGRAAVALVMSPVERPGRLRANTGNSAQMSRERFEPGTFQTLSLHPFGRITGGWMLGQQYWSQSVEGFVTPYWAAILLVSLVPAGVVAKRVGDRVLQRGDATPRRTCLRCGYDLSVTPVDSPCPECGLAAHRSLIDHMDPADCRPSWVRWIAVGSLLLLISYTMCAAYFAYFLFLKRTYDWWDASAFTPAMIDWLMLKAATLHLLACIMLSRDDRPRPFAWRPFLLRWALRLLPLPAIGTFAVWLLFRTKAFSWNYAWENASVVLLLPLLVCPTVTFIRLRQLALRLGRRRLAEHIGIVATGAGASLFMTVIGTTLVADHIRRADAVFYAFVVMPVVCVALFNLWALAMLFVITPTFFKSAREAAMRWRAADAARAMV